MASAPSTLVLQDVILVSCPCPSDSTADTYRTSWSSVHGPTPQGTGAFKQSARDKPGLASEKNQVAANMQDQRQKSYIPGSNFTPQRLLSFSAASHSVWTQTRQ